MVKKVITRIFLDKEYVNIKPSLVYELVAPSGFKIVHLLALTKDMKMLFDEVGVSIKERVVDRDVNSSNIQIGDVVVTRISPEELSYESDNEDEAKRKYFSLKANLDEYTFLGHDCETKAGEPCRRFKSQTKLSS